MRETKTVNVCKLECARPWWGCKQTSVNGKRQCVLKSRRKKLGDTGKNLTEVGTLFLKIGAKRKIGRSIESR